VRDVPAAVGDPIGELGQLAARGKVALVVDDEQSVLEVGRRMLERLGFRVIAVMRGEEAVEIFRERRDEIFLVLLDLTMPGMGGERTCQELQGIDPEVRIILASGYSEAELRQRQATLQVQGFLQKPYDFGDLRWLILSLLQPPGGD
jgi:CheY-like chemotaxis protein